MLTLVVQNQTAAALNLNDLGIVLGALGASNDTVTFTRTQAQLDAMPEFQALLVAASITVKATQVAGNAPMLTIPTMQSGVVAAVDCSGTAVKTGSISFASPYPVGIAPAIFVSLDRSNATTSKATAYYLTVTNTGFTYSVDVTTGAGADTMALHWVAVY